MTGHRINMLWFEEKLRHKLRYNLVHTFLELQ